LGTYETSTISPPAMASIMTMPIWQRQMRNCHNRWTLLDNLANADVTKNDMVEQLVLANKKLSDSVEKLSVDNARFVGIVTQLSLCRPTGTHNTTQPTVPKPAWDPTGYYWFHGFKVCCGHTGKMCTKRGGNDREHHNGGTNTEQGIPQDVTMCTSRRTR